MALQPEPWHMAAMSSALGSARHVVWFLALGAFWGVSPVLYKHLANIGMPVAHTVFVTGLGVGLAMYLIGKMQGGGQLFTRQVTVYGLICAALMNIPFALNLFLAAKVPPTELAIIISTSPFVNYLIALMAGTENTSLRRLLAIGLGFLATLVLILSRDGALSGEISIWLIASLSITLLYCAYNNYAARHFPARAGTMAVGASESVWSGLWALPFMIAIPSQHFTSGPPIWSYWVLGAATLMWIVERVAYFTLIREKGAVYTTQATYLSVPFSVLLGALVFGGGNDVWLWISLGLLMLALYVNNTGSAVSREPARV
jgi:drug/metabolite transporter (DMT)-like permease